MTKQFSPLVLLFALTFAFVTAAAQDGQRLSFDPAHQRALSLVTPDFTAEVVAQRADPESGQTRNIVLNTRTGKITVPLPFEFAQVNEIVDGPSGRLVVVEMPTSSVDVVGIIDTNIGKVIDTFSCYEPAVSPDGHYVAFTKLFPPHSSPSPEDHSMLYSVSRSAMESRPPGTQVGDETDVGFALYPWGIGTTANNMDVPSKFAHSVAGGYFWKDSQYFFADRNGDRLDIVWVVVANEIATVSSFAVPLSKFGPGRDYFPPRLVKVQLEGGSVKLAISTNQSQTLVATLADFVRLGSIDLRGQPAGAP